MPDIDITLTDANATTFNIFTGRADNSDCDICDEPALDQLLLEIAEPAAPAYICHLRCYLIAAHSRNTSDFD